VETLSRGRPHPHAVEHLEDPTDPCNTTFDLGVIQSGGESGGIFAPESPRSPDPPKYRQADGQEQQYYE
jgi:hypothetical protein